MPTPTAAANAYTALSKIADPSAGLTNKVVGGGEQDGGSFGAMLKNVLSTVVEAGRKSDGQTQAMAAGKANVVDVVTAVAETEVAVGALVAVRDKVIQSYEEIMRMPI
jgi:flagellar hook-basal body complex protein FliE